MNREEVSGLLGRKVTIRLTNVEARGVELVAALAEVLGDGVVLSEVGELGSGPTVFCPWESLHRVRERPRGSGRRTRSLEMKRRIRQDTDRSR